MKCFLPFFLCNLEIKFNLDRPICQDCYVVWKEYYNPNYLEFYYYQSR